MADVDFTPGPSRYLTVKDLLEAERKFAIRWYGILQAMQETGELPDWAKNFLEGRTLSADMTALWKPEEATNAAVSGGRRNYRYEIWDTKRNALVRGIGTLKEADLMADSLRSRYPDCVPVRVTDMSRMVFVPVEAQQ